MNRSSVRSAGLAILLTMNGCGSLVSSSDIGARAPGLNVAEAALQGGSGQIALAVSEGVLRESPKNIHAMEIKGDALALLGDQDAAAAIFQALLALNPESTRANIGMGRIRLNQDPATAEALFQSVLRREPKNLTALNNLGIARDLQNRHAEAQAIYHQALEADPNLDSAQINLALSLAMSGHGAEAVQMLRAKASEPGAAVKVRHDYAVALAMSGDRAGAEHLLNETMAPEDARQLLDSVTGTRTRLARDTSSDRVGSGRRGQPDDDGIPPDVVQVPEAQAPATRVARAPAPRAVGEAPLAAMAVSLAPGEPTTAGISGPASAPVIGPARAVTPVQPPAPIAVASTAASPPMVVRPSQIDPEAEAPALRQSVNPVSAVVTSLKPLSAPVSAAETEVSGPTADPTMVAMPRTQPKLSATIRASLAPDEANRPSSSNAPVSGLDTTPPAAPITASITPFQPSSYKLSSTPVAFAASGMPVSAPPMIQPAPRSASISAHVEQMTRTTAGPALGGDIAMALANPSDLPRQHDISSDVPASLPAQPLMREGANPAVQFAAAPSAAAAHAFWHDLVVRFPEALGQRDPVVIRVDLGGKTFWRVRTEGFGTITEAQTLCARIRADGQDCFVPRA